MDHYLAVARLILPVGLLPDVTVCSTFQSLSGGSDTAYIIRVSQRCFHQLSPCGRCFCSAVQNKGEREINLVGRDHRGRDSGGAVICQSCGGSRSFFLFFP